MPASHNGSAAVSNTASFGHPGSIPGVGVAIIKFNNLKSYVSV